MVRSVRITINDNVPCQTDCLPSSPMTPPRTYPHLSAPFRTSPDPSGPLRTSPDLAGPLLLVHHRAGREHGPKGLPGRCTIPRMDGASVAARYFEPDRKGAAGAF